MSTLTRHLLRIRLRWYFDQLREFNARFRQGIIIFFGLGPGLLALALLPFMVQSILSGRSNALQDFAFLCGLELFALALALTVRKAITGEPLAHFIASLPLSRWRLLGIDLAVLVIANYISWIIIAVGVVLSVRAASGLDDAAILIFRGILLVVLVLTPQILWFKAQRLLLAMILMVNYILIAGKSSEGYHAYLIMGGALAVTIALNACAALRKNGSV